MNGCLIGSFFMIDKIEIDNKAKEFRILPVNVQKDYVFGWLLYAIYEESVLSESFVLKGGNALRKAYYPDTRFSKDLDFSIEQEIDPEKIKSELNKLCVLVGEKTGVEFKTADTFIKPSNKFRDSQISNLQVYEARLYFKSFYGEGEVLLKIQLDITSFDKVLLPIQKQNLIHPYSDADECQTKIASHKLEEIVASKMNALLQRGKIADFFDLTHSVVINKKYEINRLEAVKTFLKKSRYEANPELAKQLLLNSVQEELRGGWISVIVPVSSFFSFDVMVEDFKNGVELLFSALTGAGTAKSETLTRVAGRSPVFSNRLEPMGLRSKIISAGRSRNLLRIVYAGISRLVEPYALEYRIRKKDGVGMEYFWAWDTSGGNSGHIGIKMFIYDKIDSVSLTDIKYKPQYPVEF